MDLILEGLSLTFTWESLIAIIILGLEYQCLWACLKARFLAAVQQLF